MRTGLDSSWMVKMEAQKCRPGRRCQGQNGDLVPNKDPDIRCNTSQFASGQNFFQKPEILNPEICSIHFLQIPEQWTQKEIHVYDVHIYWINRYRLFFHCQDGKIPKKNAFRQSLSNNFTTSKNTECSNSEMWCINYNFQLFIIYYIVIYYTFAISPIA